MDSAVTAACRILEAEVQEIDRAIARLGERKDELKRAVALLTARGTVTVTEVPRQRTHTPLEAVVDNIRAHMKAAPDVWHTIPALAKDTKRTKAQISNAIALMRVRDEVERKPLDHDIFPGSSARFMWRAKEVQ